jgi:hypothetical protein
MALVFRNSITITITILSISKNCEKKVTIEKGSMLLQGRQVPSGIVHYIST